MNSQCRQKAIESFWYIVVHSKMEKIAFKDGHRPKVPEGNEIRKLTKARSQNALHV
jgi:hypothetical protein